MQEPRWYLGAGIGVSHWNPNSPWGTCPRPVEVAGPAVRVDCPLLVDEAYVNFADTDCVGLVADHPNVIVLRTFSKGYSLAGLRLGYLIARPEIVAGLIKVKDSYNCDTLSLVGGVAALADQPYLAETRAGSSRPARRLTDALRAPGLPCPREPGQLRLVHRRPPRGGVYQALEERRILVRLMRTPATPTASGSPSAPMPRSTSSWKTSEPWFAHQDRTCRGRPSP